MNERPRVKTSVIKMNLYVLRYVFKFCPVFVVASIFSIVASVVIALAEVNFISKAIDFGKAVFKAFK